jgi:hypothetical protein
VPFFISYIEDKTCNHQAGALPSKSLKFISQDSFLVGLDLNHQLVFRESLRTCLKVEAVVEHVAFPYENTSDFITDPQNKSYDMLFENKVCEKLYSLTSYLKAHVNEKVVSPHQTILFQKGVQFSFGGYKLFIYTVNTSIYTTAKTKIIFLNIEKDVLGNTIWGYQY